MGGNHGGFQAVLRVPADFACVRSSHANLSSTHRKHALTCPGVCGRRRTDPSPWSRLTRHDIPDGLDSADAAPLLCAGVTGARPHGLGVGRLSLSSSGTAQ